MSAPAHAAAAEAGASRGHHLSIRAAWAALALAGVLSLAKLVTAVATGSAAVLSSALDAAGDGGAAFLTLIALKVARQPVDAEHRFGHGKAEGLAALAQAGFLAASSLILLLAGAARLREPTPVENPGLGMAVLIVSLVATGFVVAMERNAVRQGGSAAVRAALINHLGDLAIDAIALLGLLGATRLATAWPDAVAALGVSLWMGIAMFHVGRGAFAELMDRELPSETRAAIKAAVRAVPQVAGIHDLRTRQAGQNHFVEFHLELDPAMTVAAAHDVADAAEAAVKALLPGAEVAIHQEPAGLDDARLDHKVAAARARMATAS